MSRRPVLGYQVDHRVVSGHVEVGCIDAPRTKITPVDRQSPHSPCRHKHLTKPVSGRPSDQAFEAPRRRLAANDQWSVEGTSKERDGITKLRSRLDFCADREGKPPVSDI